MSVDQKEIDETANKIVGVIGQELKLSIKKQLKLLGKYVTHDAVESIDFYPDIKEVGSELDYLYNLEWGRKAGEHVPLPRLHRWVMMKFGMDENQAWGIVKSIEKKIFEEGIPMTRFMKKAVIDYLGV